MRIAASRREDDFEINVISLIDVLLTLLMFFVLTTTFVQNSRMQVTLPQAESSEQVEQRDAFVLLIDRDGHYFIDSNEVLNPGLDSLKEAIGRFAGDDRSRPHDAGRELAPARLYEVTDCLPSCRVYSGGALGRRHCGC